MWLFRSPFIAVLQMGNLQAQFQAQFGAFHGIWYELVVPPSATDCALDRDRMSQDAQLNWNLLDSFILIQFLKNFFFVF